MLETAKASVAVPSLGPIPYTLLFLVQIFHQILQQVYKPLHLTPVETIPILIPTPLAFNVFQVISLTKAPNRNFNQSLLSSSCHQKLPSYATELAG